MHGKWPRSESSSLTAPPAICGPAICSTCSSGRAASAGGANRAVAEARDRETPAALVLARQQTARYQTVTKDRFCSVQNAKQLHVRAEAGVQTAREFLNQSLVDRSLDQGSRRAASSGPSSRPRSLACCSRHWRPPGRRQRSLCVGWVSSAERRSTGISSICFTSRIG
jgi:hypothetical protein